jgi:hypothetical protein
MKFQTSSLYHNKYRYRVFSKATIPLYAEQQSRKDSVTDKTQDAVMRCIYITGFLQINDIMDTDDRIRYFHEIVVNNLLCSNN